MATYGVLKTGNTFTATKAGYLYVVCGVEGTYAEDDSPARVDMQPGLPFTWNVDLLDQDCYWTDRKLPLTIDVYDYWGNRISDPMVSVETAPPGGLISQSDGHYKVAGGEGDYTISATVGGAYHVGYNLPPFIADIRVDGTPPEIVITAPLRGEMLASGTMQDSPVLITGSITDGVCPIKSATLNGEPLSVGGKTSLAFSKEQSSRWGLSVIRVEAEDECGNFAVAAQSYLRSPGYFSLGASPKPEMVVQALMVQLNQESIDDGNRGDNDDLASLGQTFAQDTDLDTLLPTLLAISPDNNGDGVIDSVSCMGYSRMKSGHKVTKDGPFTYDNPEIQFIRPVDGGLKVKMTVEDLVLPVSILKTVKSDICWDTAKETGKGKVLIDQVRLEGTGWMSKQEVSVPGPNGNPSLVNQARVVLSGVVVHMQHPLAAAGLPYLDINWWAPIDSVMDQMVNSIAGKLLPQFKAGYALTPLGPVVENFFNKVGLAQSFVAPAPMNMLLNIESELDYLAFRGPENQGSAGLGLAARVFPSARGANIDVSARGPIRRNGARPDFSSTDYAFGLALKDDLVNQALWAVWYGGGGGIFGNVCK